MSLEELTSLSRVVDPRYPSNRLVLVGAPVAGLAVGAAMLLGADLGTGSIAAAVGVFLAWAMARELDPDHPASAAIAMPISFALALLVGPAALLLSTAVLLGLRISAGTVGTPLRPLDTIAIIGLSALLGTSLVGAVGVAVLVVGVLFTEERPQPGISIAVLSVMAFSLVALVSGIERTWGTPSTAEWAAISLAVVATLLVVPASKPTSATDRHTGTVSRNRVTAARVVCGLAVLMGLGLTGGAGTASLAATGAAALTGTAVRRVIGRIR